MNFLATKVLKALHLSRRGLFQFKMIPKFTKIQFSMVKLAPQGLVSLQNGTKRNKNRNMNTQMYHRLVTPAGLITQFALSVELEIIQVLGWIGAGKYLDSDLIKALGNMGNINTNR